MPQTLAARLLHSETIYRSQSCPSIVIQRPGRSRTKPSPRFTNWPLRCSPAVRARGRSHGGHECSHGGSLASRVNACTHKESQKWALLQSPTAMLRHSDTIHRSPTCPSIVTQRQGTNKKQNAIQDSKQVPPLQPCGKGPREFPRRTWVPHRGSWTTKVHSEASRDLKGSFAQFPLIRLHNPQTIYGALSCPFISAQRQGLNKSTRGRSSFPTGPSLAVLWSGRKGVSTGASGVPQRPLDHAGKLWNE